MTIKIVLFELLIIIYFKSYKCYLINDINPNMLARTMFGGDLKQATLTLDQMSVTFPGTKWCGPGHIAYNFTDLGEERETDICCRTHDHCPDFMLGGESKHNLTNNVFYTRLHCDCDNEFHKCLKAVETSASKIIGNIYFNTLNTQCFRLDYLVSGCKKKGGWFNSKCLEYTYDTTSVKRHQWFDVKPF